MTVYAMRLWSVRNARWLGVLYNAWEKILIRFHPVFLRFSYTRLDKLFLAVEKPVKGFLFDSRSCGQCTLGDTGMSCPMNCPKSMRNGPCGGVRHDGKCEVKPDMPCVWVLAWEGNKRMNKHEQSIEFVLPPVDMRLKDTSAWLRRVRQHHGHPEPENLG